LEKTGDGVMGPFDSESFQAFANEHDKHDFSRSKVLANGKSGPCGNGDYQIGREPAGQKVGNGILKEGKACDQCQE
jgi:hypothetical protein